MWNTERTAQRQQHNSSSVYRNNNKAHRRRTGETEAQREGNNAEEQGAQHRGTETAKIASVYIIILFAVGDNAREEAQKEIMNKLLIKKNMNQKGLTKNRKGFIVQT